MGIQLAAGVVLAAASAFGTHGDGRLADLIREALHNNTRIEQDFARYQAGLHRVQQAGALPDPEIAFTQHARAIETRVGSQQRMLSIAQRIPGVGKRRMEAELSAVQAAGLGARYEAQRADIVRQVKTTYFALAYLDRSIEVTIEDQRLLEHFELLARNRYAQGLGLQADVVRLQAQITQALSRREELARERIDLETALNAIRGAPPDTPIEAVQLPERPNVQTDPEALLGIARNRRPEFEAAFLEIEGREKGVHLAQRQFRPDFSFGLRWGNVRARGADASGIPVHQNGKDTYAVTVGLTLPLFRRKYNAGTREAVELLGSARAGLEDVSRTIGAEIRSTTYRIESIARQIDLYRDALLPQARQALVSAEAAYSTGSLEVTGLLDVARTVVDVRLGLSRLQADYLIALADLERASGSPVEEEDPA